MAGVNVGLSTRKSLYLERRPAAEKMQSFFFALSRKNRANRACNPGVTFSLLLGFNRRVPQHPAVYIVVYHIVYS